MRKINLPNQITLARLVVAVVFFACLAQFDAGDASPAFWLLDVCAALFFVAAVSDAIDGYLARKHNQITSFGRIFDPFVDKILVIGAYIFLAGDGFVDPDGHKISDVADWMVVVILGRELLVTGLRGATEASGQDFSANLHGKIKMVLQSVTAIWVMLTIAHPEALAFFVTLRPFMVYLTVAVTLLSMFAYLRMARGVLAQTSLSNPL
ncbi:MAG TPA: CDP-diacylglycerol--glycerol-3-phosphate 3-phosphatidyltransferase [Phycisphaerae bacterium]|nr:CDP-diacylglycerol--glycerol-3-phosphate 3-phosphatidyltransferase [Phycisphaerae bacterium]